jgi:ABC-2 type transport system permease protein
MGAAPGTPQRFPGSLLIMQILSALFLAEMRRRLMRMWAFRYDVLGEIGLWVVAFPLMMMIFDDVAGGYGPERRLASLIGFLVWDLCMGTLASITQEVTRESREGTLESVVLSPVAPSLLFVLRLATGFIVQGLRTLAIGLILAVAINPSVHLTIAVPVLLLITTAPVAGVGLALGGLALVYKNIDSVVSLVALLAVLFTGALVPLNTLGIWFSLLKFVVPMTWGIDALREAIIQDASLAFFWMNGTLIWLTLQTAVLLAIGGTVFNWGLRRARIQGSLASY